MSNRAPEIAESMHESVVGFIADRWTRWRHQHELEEFARTYPDEAGRVARDMQMETASLIETAACGSGAVSLLRSRAEHCGIDLDELGRTRADIARDLIRCCAICRSKAQCSRDLRLQPRNQIWTTYCPNSETFSAVSPDRAAGR